jgi:hypothetical protein
MFAKHNSTAPNERISPAGAGSYGRGKNIARWGELPQVGSYDTFFAAAMNGAEMAAFAADAGSGRKDPQNRVEFALQPTVHAASCDKCEPIEGMSRRGWAKLP